MIGQTISHYRIHPTGEVRRSVVNRAHDIKPIVRWRNQSARTNEEVIAGREII